MSRTRWNHTGTPNQIAITLQAIEEDSFYPLERLALPGVPELGWDDLNARAEVRHHDEHGTDEDIAHYLKGPDPEDPTRARTLAVFYTRSARIYLDFSVERDPILARECVNCEVAHGVDIFDPAFTDDVRNEFLRLYNVGGTWWEVNDYGNEYFRLAGEAWMYEYGRTYTNLPFLNSPFMHDKGVEPADVIRVLGVQRIDYVPPAPPAPEPHDHFVRYGKSIVYHESTHRVRSKFPPENLHDFTGLRPCKVCDPVLH